MLAARLLLADHDDGMPNFNCESLADRHRGVTRDELRDGIDKLFAPGADVALLYVASHGIQRGNDLILATWYSDGTDRNPESAWPRCSARSRSRRSSADHHRLLPPARPPGCHTSPPTSPRCVPGWRS